MGFSRRDFLKAAAGATALACSELWLAAERGLPFQLGIGAYTFRGIDIDAMIERYKQLKVDTMELSLPQFMIGKLQPGTLRPLKEKLDRAKIRTVSYYCGHLRSEDEIQKMAEAAKELEVHHVSGSADKAILKRLDEACAKANLNFGIHNHFFKGRKFEYESPEDILNALQGLSPRIGATLDTGHMVSCGYNPTEAFLKLKKHVRMIHLKDVEKPGDNKNVVFGMGEAYMGVFIRTLIKEKYSGVAVIEFEEGTDPFKEVQECLKFVLAYA